MKTFLTLIVIAIYLFTPTLQTNQTAIIDILVVNKNDKPVSETITFIQKKNKTIYKCQSNSNGLCSVNLPINDSYIINLQNYPNFDTIIIPDKPQYHLQYKIVVPQKPVQNCNLKLDVKNINGLLMKDEQVYLTENNTKNIQSKKTGMNGSAQFTVRPGASYNLAYKNAPDYELINIPESCNGDYYYSSVFEGSSYTYHPSRTMCLVNLYYFNYDSIPLPNEEFIITSKTSNKKYHSFTDKNGLAQILVPIGASYLISTSSLSNCVKFDVLPLKGLYINKYLHYYISTNEFIKRKAEEERLLIFRDSLFNTDQKRFNDDYNRNRTEFEKNTLEYNYFNVYNKTDVIKNRIEKKAIYTREKLKLDSHFFEKTERSILATFYRFRDKWKDKIIVVDYTCSMDPYIDETLLWFGLNLVNAELKKYLFFNDGDLILRVEDKEMGKTGGFHYVIKNSFESIIDTIKITRSLSPRCSIDGPENDIEALISAQKLMKKGSELILIADNYAPVRDIELLSQVKYPVRIILCGVVDKINEDFLEIAYKTKGSIHTIEEDLMNISKEVNGSEVKIKNNVYKISDGRFIWLHKSNTNI